MGPYFFLCKNRGFAIGLHWRSHRKSQFCIQQVGDFPMTMWGIVTFWQRFLPLRGQSSWVLRNLKEEVSLDIVFWFLLSSQTTWELRHVFGPCLLHLWLRHILFWYESESEFLLYEKNQFIRVSRGSVSKGCRFALRWHMGYEIWDVLSTKGQFVATAPDYRTSEMFTLLNLLISTDNCFYNPKCIAF